jgi:hypothetical protein
MTYEVKTPMLLEAADMARAAFRGVTSGAMDPKEANVANGSADKLIKVVGGDVRARLSAPKIAAFEARAASGQHTVLVGDQPAAV